MSRENLFFNLLWKLLPAANLAGDYYPGMDARQSTYSFFRSPQIEEASSAKPEASNCPQLEKPFRSFASYIKGCGTLPLNDRALIVLRSAHLSRAYHLLPALSKMALDQGLKFSDIQLIPLGRYAPGWSVREQLLIRAADDLYKKHGLDVKIWKRLLKLYSHGQILDIIFCAGAYYLCET
ncbi:MAG: hypothetical protein QS721_02750 [Candidatus Endonucleobacter sp. (ex Gigantidas childressi)]|nr:hypothetical protein [Candidatus Endonucleobacter sp. (ex Gigantidas childressi)]